MFREVLNIGDKIDIRHILKTGSPYPNARTYVSQLIDTINNDVIHIATPINNSTPIILNVGEYYNLCFYSSLGLFQCNCEVLKNQRENNIIVAVVRIASNLEKIQRRQYYRLECVLNADYRVISNEEEQLNKKVASDDFVNNEERISCKKKLLELNSQWIKSIIIDISGGGIRFTSSVLHESGEIIKLKLELAMGSGIKIMILGANILSSSRIYNKSGVYEHRIEFNDITKKDREEIIKYIFEQERKRRGSMKN